MGSADRTTDKHKKVEDAFLKMFQSLNVSPPSKDDFDKAIEALIITTKLAAVNDLPQARDCGDAQTRKQLEKLIKLASKLRQHIQLLKKPAREALEFHQKNEPAVSSYLLEHDLMQIMRLADFKIQVLGETNLNGRPERNQPKVVTKTALEAYKKFTGRSPARKAKNGQAYGELIIFLADIYAALDLNTNGKQHISPDSQLKIYLKHL